MRYDDRRRSVSQNLLDLLRGNVERSEVRVSRDRDAAQHRNRHRPARIGDCRHDHLAYWLTIQRPKRHIAGGGPGLHGGGVTPPQIVVEGLAIGLGLRPAVDYSTALADLP